MASTITTSVVTGGTNSHATTVAEVNAFRTDFSSPGVVGATTNTGGVGPSTGSFAVNAQGTPAMFVDVTAGTANITATPAGQSSQILRANMTANYTSYAISSNASGSTKWDWIYLSVDATKANNPDSAGDDPTALFTSRSSSNVTDNGSPPTYGIVLAVVTVANGASSINNAAISDRRFNAALNPNLNSAVVGFDYVVSGCVWTADSAGATLNASMTSGYVQIAGKLLRVSAVAARAFTASRDTYVDLSDNGDGTAAFTYTAATNNAASSALASNALRIAIVVTGGSSIAAAASINQGQEDRLLPVASSIVYTVADSLGNLICPRDPNRRVLGYKQITSNFASGTNAMTDVTGLSVPVLVPANRKIKAVIFGDVFNASGAVGLVFNIREGSTTLQAGVAQLAGANAPVGLQVEYEGTPTTSGLHTYKASMNSASGANSIECSPTEQAFIRIELM